MTHPPFAIAIIKTASPKVAEDMIIWLRERGGDINLGASIMAPYNVYHIVGPRDAVILAKLRWHNAD